VGPTWFHREDTGGFDGSVLYPRPVVGPWGRGGSFTSGDNGTVNFYDASGRLAAKVETGRTGVPVTKAILEAHREERAASLRAIEARLRDIRADRAAVVTADSLGVQRVEVRRLRRTSDSLCPSIA
jgi:hypothetical protein